MTGLPTLYRKSKLGWGVLIACLAAEALLLIWVAFITLNVAIASPTEAAQNYSLVVITVICLAWVLITLLGSIRSKLSWVRGSAVTIHVLLFAAGTGCLQLQIGTTSFGFGLIALALVGFFAAILAKPVPAPDYSEFDGSGAASDSDSLA